jgi:trimeric autotransporter adhesin
VDALGAATGLTPGSAMITAASDGITSNQVSLLVQGIPDPVTAVIEIQPTSPSIQQNANQSFTAVAKDGQGNIMEDVFFSWSSSNPAVATISGDGVAQGIAPGVAKITASGDGVTSNEASISIAAVPQEADLDFSSMVIKVSPETQTIELGGAQKFTAAATDGAGNVIESLLFTWKSSNPDTASVDKTGLAMGTMKGTSVITATAEGKVSNQALLEVTEFGQGPVASGSVIVQSVQVDPKSISVSVGSSQQYSAVAKDTQGSQVSPEGASWNSSDPKIATVDESGLATGFSKGKAIITASVNSVMSNRSTMTVRAAQQSSSVSGGCGFVRMKGGRPPDIRQIGMNTLVFFAPLVLATLFKGALRIGRMTREQLGDMFSVWNGLRVAAVSLSVFMVAVMSSEMVTMLSQAV